MTGLTTAGRRHIASVVTGLTGQRLNQLTEIDGVPCGRFSNLTPTQIITLVVSKMRKTTLSIQPDSKVGYRLHAEQWFDLPREEVFDFFSDAMELQRITPEFLHFKVLTPGPINIEAGTLLDYRLKLHGIPIRWRTEISAWEPSKRFVDQQLRGPYKRWYHEHLFEEIDGQTRVIDNVHYIPRGGSLIHRFMVKPDLLKIFGYRQDRLREIFAAKKAERPPVIAASAAGLPQPAAAS